MMYSAFPSLLRHFPSLLLSPHLDFMVPFTLHGLLDAADEGIHDLFLVLKRRGLLLDVLPVLFHPFEEVFGGDDVLLLPSFGEKGRL